MEEILGGRVPQGGGRKAALPWASGLLPLIRTGDIEFTNSKATRIQSRNEGRGDLNRDSKSRHVHGFGKAAEQQVRCAAENNHASS